MQAKEVDDLSYPGRQFWQVYELIDNLIRDF
jgi:hypothetical protein